MDEQARSTLWSQHQSYPKLWALSANGLAHSASALFQRASAAIDILVRDKPANGDPSTRHLVSDITMYSVAFMLAGFALENLLKGLRVAQMHSESPLTEEDPRFSALTATHDLMRLAREAGIPTDTASLETLRTLTEHILWVGRYPRPKKAEHFFPNDPDNPGSVKLPAVSATTWADFEKLFASTNDLITKATNGPKAP